MDSFEFSKIGGSVLLALLVIFGGRTLVQATVSPHGEQKPGYTLPAPEAPDAAPAGEAAPAAGKQVDIAALLPKADPANGEAAFKQCSGCHSIDEGGPNKMGPNLYGVVGRKRAGHEGFKYSNAMVGKGGDWTLENLAHFLHNPKGDIPGTKMAFAGIGDNEELADLIAYLNSKGGSPQKLAK